MHKVLLSIALLFLPLSVFCQQTAPEDGLIDAVTLFEGGRYDEARDSLNALVQRDSTLDAAYYYLALLDWSSKNVQGSLSNIKKAEALDTNNFWYKEMLANIYNAMGAIDKANDIYLDLLKKNPKKYRNHFTLTILADQTLAEGNDSLAVEYYNLALQYDPEYTPAKLGIAEVYMERKDYAAFFAGMRDVIADPNIQEEPKRQYMTNLFRSFNKERWDAFRPDVLNLCEALMQAHPRSTEAIQMAVQVDYIYEDYKGAIAHQYKVLDIPGIATADRVSALSTVGDLYHELGDEKTCFEVYDRALKMDPDYAPVLNNYAYFLCLKGKKLRQALKMSKKTIEAEPDNPTYLDTYGWILFLLGRPEEAKPVFKHALIYGGKSSDEVLAHYSRVLEALGENDLASYYRLQIQNKK